MAYLATFLHRSLPFASAVLPQTIDRIKAFCDKYDTETRPAEIEDQVWRMFGAADPRLGLWAIVKDMQAVVGHLMAQAEPISSLNGPWAYALIRQAESDPTEDTRVETKQVMAAVDAWTLNLGLTRVVMLTHRKPDVMARAWGFSVYKTVLDKHLTKPLVAQEKSD